MKIRRIISFISFMLLPITLNYFAPVLIVQASLEGTFTMTHIIYGLMILIAIFFGGAWCSYICPFGALQDLIPVKKIKYKLPNLKWLTGGFFLALIVVPLIMHGFDKVILPYHMQDTKVSVSSFRDLMRYYIITTSIIVISVVLGRRAWCRYICPMYVFNYIGKKIRDLFKIPSLRKVSDKEKCVHCKKCTKSCVMGLDVEEMVKNNEWNDKECINCGECTKSCSCDAIKIKWK